jgi:hypothetical protein
VQSNKITKEIIARKFAIGQVLDIEIQDTGNGRFQSTLIGMKEGKYLLTSMPSLTRHGNLRDLLLDDQDVIVRTICEKTTGECLGFKSHVYAKLKQPEQLLFLAFPTTLQVHELRNENRMLVTQSAQILLDNGVRQIVGLITDFSASGCHFEYASAAADLPRKDDRVDICFRHPESAQDVRSGCRICSVKIYQDIVRIGMAFEK